MANVLTTQILEDGDRNVVANIECSLDTSNLAATTVLDPATLATRVPAATQLSIVEIEFAVQDGLQVQVLWDATADVVAFNAVGRGEADWADVGGLINNAGAGKTGAIQLSTTGWTAGVLVFAMTLRCRKQ